MLCGVMWCDVMLNPSLVTQSMWADVVRTKEKAVEVQVTAAHPTLGKMGCTLSIQKLHLRVS